VVYTREKIRKVGIADAVRQLPNDARAENGVHGLRGRRHNVPFYTGYSFFFDKIYVINYNIAWY
jgi:hypothetical protein